MKMSDTIKQIIVRPVQLADKLIKTAELAVMFKNECLQLKFTATKLSDMLRKAARKRSRLYERPARRIIKDTEQVLEKALSLANKCRGNGLLKLAFTTIPANSFRKIFSELENSSRNISWLLRLSTDVGSNSNVGLPPIAANEPILCLIWEQIAVVSKGRVDDQADAAGSLAALARDKDQYGKLIIEEGGIGPLLKLLQEGKLLTGQENAAQVIGLLARDPESVDCLVHAGVCSVFSKILKEGPMQVQATVAWAVSELAAKNPKCQDSFLQQNVVRLLVSHLAFEIVQEHNRWQYAVAAMTNTNLTSGPTEPQTPITLIDLIASVTANNGNNKGINWNGKFVASHDETLAWGKLRESVDPAIKAKMKAMTARALWHLAKGNSTVCHSICESRALLCFAVLLEKGDKEVQHNSAMAVMEITAVAEKDPELRRSIFKPNLPSCKAVVDQLVEIINMPHSELLLPCVTSIGNLAKTFKLTETRMIPSLVQILAKGDTEVSREAAIALAKFVHIDNYLRVGHSTAIIQAGGLKHLVSLVYFGEQRVQVPALVLLSYIALNVPESEELAKCQALAVFEWALKRSQFVQDESVENFLVETKSKLELYQCRVFK